MSGCPVLRGSLSRLTVVPSHHPAQYTQIHIREPNTYFLLLRPSEAAYAAVHATKGTCTLEALKTASGRTPRTHGRRGVQCRSVETPANWQSTRDLAHLASAVRGRRLPWRLQHSRRRLLLDSGLHGGFQPTVLCLMSPLPVQTTTVVSLLLHLVINDRLDRGR